MSVEETQLLFGSGGADGGELAGRGGSGENFGCDD